MQKRSLDICTAHRGRADGSCSNTSDNALSIVARLQRSRGWELGKKDAICGNCTDVPLCSDTILTAGFLCVDSCRRLNGISMMTHSQRLSGINVKLGGVLCVPLSFDFAIIHLCDDMNIQERQPASSF